ncbi:MAG TPA: M12 family metallo-peptidase [Fibrobacteria bacterium]|nr:M12 family metallo-peptidase [Fibrobacteria bacterium]
MHRHPFQSRAGAFFGALALLLLSVPAQSQTYRVLVAYTPAVEAALPSTLRTFVRDWAITTVNQIYANSPAPGVAMPSLELAGIVRVNYNESGSITTDVNRLRITNDGFMDEVHVLRDLYAADVVFLLTDASYSGSVSCVSSANNCTGPNDGIGANAAFAFFVVEWDRVQSTYSSAHETGHLFGCRHDLANDPTNVPYAYGHGYRFDPPGTEPEWTTVMSYGENRQRFFSNPDMTHLGAPRGTAATANCTRVHNERRDDVAGFRAPQSSATVQNLTIGNQQFADIVAINGISTSGNVVFQGGSEGRLQAPGATLNPGFRVDEGANITISAGSPLAKAGASMKAAPAPMPMRTDKQALPGIPTAFSARVRFEARSAVLDVALPEAADLQYRIFDARGNLIGRGRPVTRSPGYHTLDLEGELREKTMYFLELRVGHHRHAQKFLMSL